MHIPMCLYVNYLCAHLICLRSSSFCAGNFNWFLFGFNFPRVFCGGLVPICPICAILCWLLCGRDLEVRTSIALPVSWSRFLLVCFLVWIAFLTLDGIIVLNRDLFMWGVFDFDLLFSSETEIHWFWKHFPVQKWKLKFRCLKWSWDFILFIRFFFFLLYILFE